MLKRSGIAFCLVGPAGSGKTSLGEDLLKTDPHSLRYSVSVTTRAPRPGEVHGTHYFFISREEFLARKAKGDFFETEEVHGNLYGTLKATVTDALESGQDLVLDVDIKGAFRFKQVLEHKAIVVFLVPPTFAELEKRIRNRSQISAEELNRRLATARAEYEAFLSASQDAHTIDYLVINEKRELALASLQAIVHAERLRACRFDNGAKKNLLHS